ncbi:unnamed protein product [Closterium sp. NIES-65]|nr:unnamed protein product [Closterium sp. NIES-65]
MKGPMSPLSLRATELEDRPPEWMALIAPSSSAGPAPPLPSASSSNGGAGGGLKPRRVRVLPVSHPSHADIYDSGSPGGTGGFIGSNCWAAFWRVVHYLFPCTKWMAAYNLRDDLLADLIAGISVGTMLVPQSMSYAKLAGLPPIYGLYSAFVPILSYVVFGSSRQLAVGPVAIVSILTFNGLRKVVAEKLRDSAVAAGLAATAGGVGGGIELPGATGLGGFQPSRSLLDFRSSVGGSSNSGSSGGSSGISSSGALFPFPVSTAARQLSSMGWGITAAELTGGGGGVGAGAGGMLGGGAGGAVGAADVSMEELAVLLALMVGLLEVLMGLLRMGWLVRFLSHSVVSGFTSGAALLVCVSVAKDILGFSMPGQTTFVAALSHIIKQIMAGKAHWEPMALGGGALLLLLLMKEAGKSWKSLQVLRCAGPFTSIVLGALVVKFWRPPHVPVVGEIPQGLPSLSTAFPWEYFPKLLPTALVITGVAILESCGIAKALAARNGYAIDANQELFGLGMANVLGSFFSSFPTTGSFSRSAVNNEVGARTALSGLIMALMVVATLLFLTPAFRDVPQCVLAAVVVNAVHGLVDLQEPLFLWRVEKKDLVLWFCAFLGTLLLGLETGVLISVALSLVFVIHESANPHMAVLGRLPGTTVYRNVKQYRDAYTYRGVVILRIDSPIYFANVDYIKERLRKYELQRVAWWKDGSSGSSGGRLAGSNGGANGMAVMDLRFLILEMSPVTYIDSTAVHALKELYNEYKARDIQLCFSNPSPKVMLTMARAGFPDLIGRQWYFVRIHDAVQVCLALLEDTEITIETPSRYQRADSSAVTQQVSPTPGLTLSPHLSASFVNLAQAAQRASSSNSEGGLSTVGEDIQSMSGESEESMGARRRKKQSVATAAADAADAAEDAAFFEGRMSSGTTAYGERGGNLSPPMRAFSSTCARATSANHVVRYTAHRAAADPFRIEISYDDLFPHIVYLNDLRHDPDKVKDGSAASGDSGLVSKWRMKDRMKTSSVAIVLCLNIGVDPPDVIKISPCARVECWIDPFSMQAQKALDTIGKNLQAQYERWQPKARYKVRQLGSHNGGGVEAARYKVQLDPTVEETRYKVQLDPTVEEVKKLCVTCRHNAKAERVLFHYNGHGVPKPPLPHPPSSMPPQARYKVQLDPTVEEVKKLCLTCRRNAKAERVLFHYNGHGVPKPTGNGEIWVFNKTYTQYIPLSVYELDSWLATPSIYVFDCSAAGIIINAFVERPDWALAAPSSPLASPTAASREAAAATAAAAAAAAGMRDRILLAACGPEEILPQPPDLPADLFTACLTTPIKIALQWFCSRSLLRDSLDPEMVERIPGRQSERKTALGELNWIFTAVTDTIAWNTLPTHLFQRLFRQDLLVASLFRNFLLAERVMRASGCTPVSYPRLPPTHQHHLWHAWDMAAEMCLAQLPTLLADPNAEFQPSSFFSQQLMAFEVWLEHGSDKKRPPEQLPIVLQVLLSHSHRLRALVLLGRFLDMGPWAVDLALSVGIFPYVLKLLQTSAVELRQILVFIWTKILALDKTCQVDLVRDGGHMYFIKCLETHEPYSSDPRERATVAFQRAMAAFVLALICDGHPKGHQACLQAGLIPLCLMHIQAAPPAEPLLLQWLCLCVGKLWGGAPEAQAAALAQHRAPQILSPLLSEPQPEGQQQQAEQGRRDRQEEDAGQRPEEMEVYDVIDLTLENDEGMLVHSFDHVQLSPGDGEEAERGRGSGG